MSKRVEMLGDVQQVKRPPRKEYPDFVHRNRFCYLATIVLLHDFVQLHQILTTGGVGLGPRNFGGASQGKGWRFVQDVGWGFLILAFGRRQVLARGVLSLFSKEGGRMRVVGVLLPCVTSPVNALFIFLLRGRTPYTVVPLLRF